MSDKAKSLSKSDFLGLVALECGMTKKDVYAFYSALEKVIERQLQTEGQVQLPGLVKMTKYQKPAREGGMKPNPFKKGEMMEVKARPPKNAVKLRLLRNLKAMV